MGIKIKHGRQIDCMRRACAIARDILLETAARVEPGISTAEIDALAVRLMEENGCTSAFLGYRGFPGNICISINEEVVHGIGGPRAIQYGDIVKIDVGIVKDGWVGDNALTVPVGEIEPETYRLLYATEESLMAAIEFARDGVMLGDLCHAVEECVKQYGYTVVRDFVGHGVGKSLHEDPQIPNYGKRGKKPRLRSGMTLAIEPMVNLGGAEVKILDDDWTVVTKDGKPSAHYEHTVLVTSGDPEILTARERITSSSGLGALKESLTP